MNIEAINREHYDDAYAGYDVNLIVAKVRNWESFLSEAVRSASSWRGFYCGDFQHELAGRRVVDVGAGDGMNSLIMAALGAEVIAVDISDASATLINTAARDLGWSNRVSAYAGDFTTLDLGSEPFDYVVGKAILHHLTHDVERQFIARAAQLIRRDGQARFFESAVNSQMLDKLRWMIPVPGRPSILQTESFRRWKENDPHPDRDHSTKHYRTVGLDYFHEVEIFPIGGLQRVDRFLPKSEFSRRLARLACRVEGWLPDDLQLAIARGQTIIMRRPRD